MEAATEDAVAGEVVAPDDQAMIPTGGGLLVDTDRMKFGDHFEWTRVGLTILGRPSMGVCGDMVKVLELAEQSLQFVIGDFLNYADGVFGEEASQLISESGWTESTQKVYQWVASKVPPQYRRSELTFLHHQIIAKLNTPEEQKLWLDRAVEGIDGRRWTVAELKKAMNASARDVVFNTEQPKFLVVVECESTDDVQACCRQLENLGRKFSTKLPATT